MLGIRPLCALFLLTTCTLVSADDWEYWNRESAEIKILSDHTLYIEEGLRFRDNFKEFYYQYTDFAFRYRKFVIGGIWFFLRWGYTKSGDEWRYELRPFVYFSPQAKLLGFTFANRSRPEYRGLEKREDVWRYRNQTSISRPRPFPLLIDRITAYYEWFWNLNNGIIDQQRLGLRLRGRLSRWLDCETYYMLRRQKRGGGWVDAGIIGTTLRARW